MFVFPLFPRHLAGDFLPQRVLFYVNFCQLSGGDCQRSGQGINGLAGGPWG